MKRETGGDIIGLDIGGSKTRGIRWVAGEVAGDATSGSANVQNVTAAQARHNLTAVFAALGEGPVAHVIAGSGGIDTDDDANELKDLIQPLVLEAEVSLVHDSRLLLAAADKFWVAAIYRLLSPSVQRCLRPASVTWKSSISRGMFGPVMAKPSSVPPRS